MPSKCYEFKSLGLRTNFETKKYSRAKHIDRRFEERVIQYIEDNKHKSFIDADTLVDSLRKQFPEYMRRQRAAIKYLAGRAVAKLTDEVTEVDAADSSMAVDPIASDISSDDELSANRDSLPSMNRTLTDLYKPGDLNTSQVSQFGDVNTSNVSHDEFINISSDDNIEESSNGASSSSSSVSTITIDDDQVKNVDSSVTRKRKLSDQSEAVTPSEVSVSTTVAVVDKLPTIAGAVVDKLPTNGIVKAESTPISIGRKKAEKKLIMRNKGVTPTANKSVLEDTPCASIPSISFTDVAGCQNVIAEVVRLMMHIFHPEIYNHIGIDPPRGFLLHGPPGCGKTLLAHAVAGELEIPLLDVAAPELVAGVSGISEQRIRKLFDNAIKISPCVMFIDEIDCITQNRDITNRDMERRIVSQLLSSLDKLNRDPKGAQVLVIGATNRPDSLDPALRRAGRFDREVCMGIPDKEARYDILRFMCSKLKLAEDVCLREIAAHTPGYVGADLLSLIRESALSAVHRAMEAVSRCDVSSSLNSVDQDDSAMHVDVPAENEIPVQEKCDQLKKTLTWIKNKSPINPSFLNNVCVTTDDVQLSLKRVQPSSKREGFATIPNVTWNDVGSLKDIREALQLAILAPVKYPKHFSELGLPLSMGVLLCGPPGCGKTLIAKAIANEAGINFISVKGPELLNMYVGGSEKAVRECFQRAKNSQPCVIFFDELDALCPKRSDHTVNSAGMRVVNQLLTEMDGVEGRSGVLLMAATNRPDIIDPAVLRPGRLDKTMYVGFPNEEDRIDILRALTKNGTKPPLEENVKLTDVAKNPLCDGFTGADLAALVRDASMLALSECIFNCNKNDNDRTPVKVSAKHFESALQNLRPSVSEKDRNHYEQLRLKFATSTYQLQKKD